MGLLMNATTNLKALQGFTRCLGNLWNKKKDIHNKKKDNKKNEENLVSTLLNKK